MEITEVRIKLMDGTQDRLLGFCSITIDGAFVIRDLKIIHGARGPFVAMPSRKLMDRCPDCGAKNQLRAAYCSQCGVALGSNRSVKLPDGRAKLYADIAHPINNDCRELIQRCVMEAYEQERELAKDPDYICRYEEFDSGDDLDHHDSWPESPGYDRASTEGPVSAHRIDGLQQSHPHTAGAGTRSHQSVAFRQEDFGAGLF
ncbi:MAG: SpoVG family protein [Planctomycetaceae bacterium]|nr:SpoVG family protein [Planctomycetaceae bacterium]